MNLKPRYCLQCPESRTTKSIVHEEREREREEEKKMDETGDGLQEEKEVKLSKMLNLVSNNFKAAIIDYHNYV